MATRKLSLAGPATLRDVARLAGVHPGTVSRALNPQTRGLVNERTARRVLDAAQELGYRPNPIARGLRTNRSHTIGVLVPDLMNPLFAAVVRGIEDGLREGGYTPLIANTDNDAERERVAYEAMSARQVDGFIAATARRDHWLLADQVQLGAEGGAGQPAGGQRRDPRRHRRRPRGHPAGRRAPDRASATSGSPTWPAHRRCTPAGRVTRASSTRCAPAASSSNPDLIVFSDAFTEREGGALLLRAARPAARLHRDRGRQRSAGPRLLRRARAARPVLPGGRLGGRLQRHAVRGPLPSRRSPPSGFRTTSWGRPPPR